MSEPIADTPDLSEVWCPGCRPERDPLREILRVDWCGHHLPDRTGLDDRAALEAMPSGTSMIVPQEGGVDGARWCAILRGRPR